MTLISDEIGRFVALQEKLLKEEQEAEERGTVESQSGRTDKELIKQGVLLTNMKETARRSGLNGSFIIQFEMGIGIEGGLPTNKFKVGDAILIEGKGVRNKADKGTDLDDWKMDGTVVRVTSSILTISTKDTFVDDAPMLFRISRGSNTNGYKRMRDALKWLEKQKDSPSPLVEALFQSPLVPTSLQGLRIGGEGEVQPISQDEAGSSVAENEEEKELFTFFDESLNQSQRNAVKACLKPGSPLHLIHGPPGCGKTHTLVEVIRQLAKANLKLLVCGPSNISVDNLTERLAKSKLDIVRIGHSARVLPSVIDHALDLRIHASNQGEMVRDVRKELDLTLGKIKNTKRKGEKFKLYQTVKDLRQELREREKVVLQSTISNAQVVLCTLNGAATNLLKHYTFDVLLIDEASQSLEAENIIAVAKCRQKLILAGDHLQLPATIHSSGTTGKALSYTLFERMMKIHSGQSSFLDLQYRMNEIIMRFSSKEFYNSKLLCGSPEVANRLLIDLKGVTETEETTRPLIFIDTAGHDLFETSDSVEDSSKYNEGELQIVEEYLKEIIAAGVSEEDIVVISPYNAQIGKLKVILSSKYPGVELGSIDGLQGREKEVVILTLVRSNDQGKVGFLSERRRLNVAITRAKRHLAIIGDSNTLARGDPFLKRLVEYLVEVADCRYPL